jgi:hypothetical protein
VKTATYLRDVPGGNCEKRLYLLSESVVFQNLNNAGRSTSYVISHERGENCSHAGIDTFFVPAGFDGEPISRVALFGRFASCVTPEQALRHVGYEVVGKPVGAVAK